MKILWFPRLQFDIDRLHLTTWREMCRAFMYINHEFKIAIAGKYNKEVFEFENECIVVPTVKKKFLRILSFWIFGFFKFLVNYYRFKPDVVILHLFTIWFSLPILLIPRKKRALIILDIRSPIYGEALKVRPKDIILRAYMGLCYYYCRFFLDGITVITEYFKKHICGIYKIPSSFVGVWGSGVKVSDFSPEKFKSAKRPPFLSDKFVVMQHGEISSKRGILETIEAMRMVREDDACLVMLGDPINSTIKQDILDLTKKFSLESKVYILPPVPHSEIPRYLSYCDCAIMAYPKLEYWNFNNPIKLSEYLSMEKVVICTDMWTFKSVMNNKKCAYYVRENTPKNIAVAIDYCCDNKSNLKEWGRTGREIVSVGFTWEKQAEKLLNFIDKLKKHKNEDTSN